jgi:hypothetical protein
MISTGTAGQKELLPPHANKWTGGDGYGTPEKARQPIRTPSVGRSSDDKGARKCLRTGTTF